MKNLREGTRIHSWVFSKAVEEGDGYREFLVEHSFAGLQGEIRVFGPEFREPPEVKRWLQLFLFAFAQCPHPGILPVLDCGEMPDAAEGSLYLVRGLSSRSLLQEQIREAPLDTRERILPFLQALAAFTIDAQGLRFGIDRLTSGDFTWDGRCMTVTGIAWSMLFEGPVRRRLPSLAAAWERDFSHGIYPLGEKAFPRTDSLVKIGHLAYEAAGIQNPDKRILEGPAKSPSETSSAAAPLVEGWGVAIEALVRRCLFAHQPGMLDKAEAVLEIVETLMRGDVPEACRHLPSVSTGAAAARERRPTAADTHAAIREPAESTIIPTPSSLPAPARAFTPLGAEAARLDATTKSKAGAARAAHHKPAKAVVAELFSPDALVWWRRIGMVAGLLAAGAIIIVLVLMLFSGHDQPNKSPTAAIGPVPAVVKETETIALDASGCSDPEGDALTYVWSVEGLSKVDYQMEPDSGRAAVKAKLRIFKRGTFTVTLRVFDGREYSEPQSVTIRVEGP